MALTYGPDQQLFRRSVSDVMKRVSPLSTLRAWRNTVEDDDRVRAGVARTLDLLPMTVPEAQGGGGFAFADIAAGVEQLGAGLLPGSTSPTLPALRGLGFGGGGDEASAAAAELVDSRAAVCLDASGMTVETDDAVSFRLTGRLPVVDGGSCASRLVCAAVAPDGPGLFLVDLDDSSVSRQTLQTLDLTRDAGELAFDATAVRRLRRPAGDEIGRVRAVAAVTTSLESVGAMQALLNLAVDYARQRFQFGRQIGSYQAVKHRLVDMQVEFELARAATLGAVEQVDRHDDTLLLAASAAKAACADTGPHLAQEAIGIFGGIGYSWEHDAHLYFRRLNYLAALHGAAAEHLDLVIDELTRQTGGHQ